MKLNKETKKAIKERGAEQLAPEGTQKLGDMDWSMLELIQWLQNFSFYNRRAGRDLKLTMLKPEFKDQLVEMAREMSQVLGKHLSSSFRFIS